MHLRNEHYLQYIKGQNERTLTLHMLKLQKEKIRVVRKFEQRQMGAVPNLSVEDLNIIQHYRWYLDDTLLALANLGQNYTLNQTEQKARLFQEKIPEISRLGFYIGGYLGGIEKYEVEINRDKARMTYSLSDTNSISPFILMEPDYLCKEVFFHFVESIYMGEWKQEYEHTQKNVRRLSNTLWGVEVSYADKSEKISFSGFNAFPYNFNQFLHFFESYKKKVYTI